MSPNCFQVKEAAKKVKKSGLYPLPSLRGRTTSGEFFFAASLLYLLLTVKIDLNIFTPICMEINTTLMNYGITLFDTTFKS